MLDFPDPFSPVIELKLSSLGFVSGVFPSGWEAGGEWMGSK